LKGWVVLQLAYLLLWSWTIAARFVLPLMVPFALIAARAYARPGQRWNQRGQLLLGVTTAATALSAIVLVSADASLGDFHRSLGGTLSRVAQANAGQTFFSGSWGFQYYAERAGLRRLDLLRDRTRPGDLIAITDYVTTAVIPEGPSV